MKDMVLVTGCDLTTKWATAAFAEDARERQFRFTAVRDSSLATIQSSRVWMTYHVPLRVTTRVGPRQRNDSRGDRVQASQCVFVRGYRISERFLVPRVIKAAAKPEDLERHRDDEGLTRLAVTKSLFDSDDEESSDDEELRHDVRHDLHHSGVLGGCIKCISAASQRI